MKKEARLRELEAQLAAKLEAEKKMKELAKVTTYSGQGTQMGGTGSNRRGEMIEITLNDRLGKKVRVKIKYVLLKKSAPDGRILTMTPVTCSSDATVGQLKKLAAAQTGTQAAKIRIQKWYHISSSLD